jgi:hypothetical protein
MDLNSEIQAPDCEGSNTTARGAQGDGGIKLDGDEKEKELLPTSRPHEEGHAEVAIHKVEGKEDTLMSEKPEVKDERYFLAGRVVNHDVNDDDDDDTFEDWDDASEFGSEQYVQWKVGDVIGLACDPAAGTISASVNGVFIPGQRDQGALRAAFVGIDFRGPGLYPALSGSQLRVRYNFGPSAGMDEFRYPPPPTTNMDQWLFASKKKADDAPAAPAAQDPASAAGEPGEA